MQVIIAPVDPAPDGVYTAMGEVERVFDTNDLGALLPVRFERVDGRSFRLPYPPYRQVYAEVATTAFD